MLETQQRKRTRLTDWKGQSLVNDIIMQDKNGLHLVTNVTLYYMYLDKVAPFGSKFTFKVIIQWNLLILCVAEGRSKLPNKNYHCD